MHDLGTHADIVGRPVFQDGKLINAWIQRDTPLARTAAFLDDPIAAHVQEVALYGGSDTPQLLATLARHRPDSLKTVRFGATEPVDLTDLWPHLEAYTKLALSGPVHTGPIVAPGLDYLGWVDRKGTGVRFGPSVLGVRELWSRTTATSLASFLNEVDTPALREMTVADPTPLLDWRGLQRLEGLTVSGRKHEAVVRILCERAPSLQIRTATPA